MHVISQDFDSDCLKNKKHWNSFTTPFFIGSRRLASLVLICMIIADIYDQLKQEGKVTIDREKSEEYLKRNLKCHKCIGEFKTIPALKAHIATHVAV